MIGCGVYTWLIMYCFGKYYSMLYAILYSPRRAGQHSEAEHQHLGRQAVLLVHLRACGVVAANGRAGGFRSQPSPQSEQCLRDPSAAAPPAQGNAVRSRPGEASNQSK